MKCSQDNGEGRGGAAEAEAANSWPQESLIVLALIYLPSSRRYLGRKIACTMGRRSPLAARRLLVQQWASQRLWLASGRQLLTGGSGKWKWKWRKREGEKRTEREKEEEVSEKSQTVARNKGQLFRAERRTFFGAFLPCCGCKGLAIEQIEERDREHQLQSSPLGSGTRTRIALPP